MIPMVVNLTFIILKLKRKRCLTKVEQNKKLLNWQYFNLYMEENKKYYFVAVPTIFQFIYGSAQAMLKKIKSSLTYNIPIIYGKTQTIILLSFQQYSNSCVECTSNVSLQWFMKFLNEMHIKKMTNDDNYNSIVLPLYKNKGNIKNCSDYISNG